MANRWEKNNEYVAIHQVIIRPIAVPYIHLIIIINLSAIKESYEIFRAPSILRCSLERGREREGTAVRHLQPLSCKCINNLSPLLLLAPPPPFLGSFTLGELRIYGASRWIETERSEVRVYKLFLLLLLAEYLMDFQRLKFLNPKRAKRFSFWYVERLLIKYRLCFTYHELTWKINFALIAY